MSVDINPSITVDVVASETKLAVAELLKKGFCPERHMICMSKVIEM